MKINCLRLFLIKVTVYQLCLFIKTLCVTDDEMEVKAPVQAPSPSPVRRMVVKHNILGNRSSLQYVVHSLILYLTTFQKIIFKEYSELLRI